MTTIVIAGGAGYLGHHLACWFREQGCRVMTLTRRPKGDDDVLWDGVTVGWWHHCLEGADALINLAGRSVNCRYHKRNREEILRSRLDSTRALGLALAACKRPPAVWLNSASATIYRYAEDKPMTEEDGEIGEGFSVSVCQAWEKEFFQAAPDIPVRKVALRSAMVMGPGNDGVFAAFHRIVRLGLGGTLGHGRQFVSWIHLEDWMRAVTWLLEEGNQEGVFNLTSLNPLPNRELMRILREQSGMPVGLPAARWMLEIGALFLRTETELLLKSRRVAPDRLIKAGFVFRYPQFPEAVRQILQSR